MPDTQWGPHKWWWLSLTTIPQKPRARRNLSHHLTLCRWSSRDPLRDLCRHTVPFSLLPRLWVLTPSLLSSGAGMRHVGPESSCCSLPCSDYCTARWGPFGADFPPVEVAPLGKVRVESSPGVTFLHPARPAAVRAPRRAAQCPDGTGRARVRASTPGLGAAQDTRKSSTRFSQYITREMPSLCT